MPPGAAVVDAPAGFVPEHVVAFGAAGSAATPVDQDHPLPTAAAMVAATSTPLTGSTSASGTFGPFAPQLGRAIWLRLSGTWSGTAALLRSTDAGTTKLALTLGGQPWASFTANAQEPIGEETDASATYYLSVTLASGTIAYRVSQ